MSGDREARVVAAGPSIEIDDKQYRLRPVSVQQLCDLELDALEYYKRQYLKTYARNVDLLDEKRSKELIEQKIEAVARWDVDDLPQKDAHDAGQVPVTEKIKEWIEEAFGELPSTDAGTRALLANALDTKRITPSEVKEMAGKGPLRGMVRYDQWWVTATLTGMVSFIAGSIQQEHPEVTREQVSNWSFVKVAEAARKVESVTTPAVGNT